MTGTAALTDTTGISAYKYVVDMFWTTHPKELSGRLQHMQDHDPLYTRVIKPRPTYHVALHAIGWFGNALLAECTFIGSNQFHLTYNWTHRHPKKEHKAVLTIYQISSGENGLIRKKVLSQNFIINNTYKNDDLGIFYFK